MKDTNIIKLQKLDYIIRRVYVVALIIGGAIPIVEGIALGFMQDKIEEFEKIRLTIILIYLFISTIIYLAFMAMMIVKESLFTNKKFNLRIGLYSFLIATDILDIALLLRIFKTGFADKSLLIAAVAIAVGTILVGTALTFDDLVNRKRSLSIEETLKKTDNNMETHV